MERESKIKLVVWDLDNTVWEGVLSSGDDLKVNPKAIEVMKELDNRGILQSISSKNNWEDAVCHLKRFGIYDYFLYPAINWGAKSENIKKIIEAINIASDTVAFIDDQEFEREEVRYGIKDILCLDAADIDILLDMPEFNPTFITEDSKVRRKLYMADIERKKIEDSFEGAQSDFLKSLGIQMSVESARIKDLKRVEELTVRTNQLNSTGYTYSYDELLEFIDSDNHKLFVISLDDKYGTYGKIGIALIETTEKKWTLKLLLISCRVMNRGIGSAMLGVIGNMAYDNKVALYADFVQTGKNRAMAVTYAMMGYKQYKSFDDREVLEYVKKNRVSLPNYINVLTDNNDYRIAS